jgi:flagellin-specific chaperone FliS
MMSLKQYTAFRDQSMECIPRIDLLLMLFDETMRKLEQAREAFQGKGRDAARPLLQRAQLLIGGLAAGVIPNADEVATNCLRLYEFATHRLGSETLAGVEDALRVLRPLWEGFQGIRDEGVQLERAGMIPPAQNAPAFEATV